MTINPRIVRCEPGLTTNPRIVRCEPGLTTNPRIARCEPGLTTNPRIVRCEPGMILSVRIYASSEKKDGKQQNSADHETNPFLITSALRSRRTGTAA